jgi:hypothetical protein
MLTIIYSELQKHDLFAYRFECRLIFVRLHECFYIIFSVIKNSKLKNILYEGLEIS